MLGMATAWQKTIELLLPARCVGCGAHGAYLCEACARGMPYLQPPACPGCAAQGWDARCPRCHAQPFAFDRATAAFRFAGAARTAVHRLKYQDLRALAPVMAGAMAEALEHSRVAVDVVVPVALHPKQLRRRGYNQAALLARGVGARLGVRVHEGALVRRRDTSAQVEMTSEEARHANMADAFEAAAGVDLAGQAVVLVDDVLTTGSTLHSAAAALKVAGAMRVHALVYARDV